MQLRAHHAQVTVDTKDEALAREFYCGLLGLRELEKPDSLKGKGGFWLDAGSIQVHVSLQDDVERARSKVHVAYIVEDLESWRLKLASHGIQTALSTPIPGFARFEFRDPFGNRVEFLEREET